MMWIVCLRFIIHLKIKFFYLKILQVSTLLLLIHIVLFPLYDIEM